MRNRMRLIPEWRRCLRMFSQQAFLAAGALQATWLTLAPEQKASIPDAWVTATTLVILLLGFVGRLVVQESVHAADR